MNCSQTPPVLRRVKAFEPSEAEMERINAYTRRKFSPEEVYTFSVILCDNDVDRDYEQFSNTALEKLAELFLGKSGVFDHNPSVKNQTARIYDCRTEPVPGQKTAAGEDYIRLAAKAYMVRSASNRDLIAEIDGGIKKEVSISCSVAETTCSICGADASAGCLHQKGRKYGDSFCHHILNRPTDAYEWSFVAVPAQKRAGVIKSFAGASESVREFPVLKQALTKGEGLQFSPAEAAVLAHQLEELEESASWGRKYKSELEQEMIRLAFLAEEELDSGILASAVRKLSVEELRAFCKAYEARVAPSPVPSLLPSGEEAEPSALFKM